MALETVLLAVGPNDANRIDELASTVVDIAGPAGAEVVVAHVFTDDEYETAVERLEFEAVAQAEPDEVADRHATVRELRNLLTEAGISTSVRGAVGDHGDEFDEHGLYGHKNLPYDELTRVPLLIQFPDSVDIDQPNTVDTMVRTIDILPTFLDLAESNAPDPLTGIAVEYVRQRFGRRCGEANDV